MRAPEPCAEAADFTDKEFTYKQSVFMAWRMAIFSPLLMKARAAARTTARAQSEQADDDYSLFMAFDKFRLAVRISKEQSEQAP